MRTRMIKLAALFVLVGIASFCAFGKADAQVSSSPTCLNFSSNMGFGTSSGNVVALQNFLNGNGYMSYASTGYFGPITYEAVVKFQGAYGIPNTGFVGPLTRAEISALSCGNVVPPPPQSDVSISSLSASSGPVGTTISLMGTGFTDDNTVYFAGGAIQHIAMNQELTSSGGIACSAYSNCVLPQETLNFTIPSSIGPYCAAGVACPEYVRLITPGTYSLYVSNANGTSNTVNFTVTSATVSSSSLSITGIDAPNSLALDAAGTWTVHALAGMSGNLHYSVTWGDEMTGMNVSFVAPTALSTQSSATFSHEYMVAGTYDPTFTVLDDYGHSATASASVTVTPLY